MTPDYADGKNDDNDGDDDEDDNNGYNNGDDDEFDNGVALSKNGVENVDDTRLWQLRR